MIKWIKRLLNIERIEYSIDGLGHSIRSICDRRRDSEDMFDRLSRKVDDLENDFMDLRNRLAADGAPEVLIDKDSTTIYEAKEVVLEPGAEYADPPEFVERSAEETAEANARAIRACEKMGEKIDAVIKGDACNEEAKPE
jgi:hypothetical protein